MQTSYSYYQNISRFLDFYNAKMNVAFINGYTNLQDILQGLFERALSLESTIFSVERKESYWSVAIVNRLKDLDKRYEVKFAVDSDCMKELPFELSFDGDDTLLKKGLSELTLKQGQVLTLYLEGLKLSEIAERLQVSRPAISKLWKKIEKHLKESDSFKENFGADLDCNSIESSENYYNYCLDNEVELRHQLRI